MSRDYFVNRHGKKSSIEGVVSEIADLERTEPVVARPIVHTPKRHRSMPRLRFSKKYAIIFVVSVVVVAAGALVVADAARRSYQLQTATMKTSVKNLVSKTSSTETSAKDAIKGLSSQLTAVTACGGKGTIITSLYAPAKQAADECSVTAVTYNSITSSLQTMNEVVGYLDTQKTTLAAALATPSDGVFAEIPTEVTSWKNAYSTLLKITPPKQVSTAHQGLIKRVKVVVDAWGDLSTAQSSQDVAAFTTSEAKLTKAYDDLRDSSVEFDSVVTSLQNDIQTGVTALR